jgi:hypothetical protein
MPVAARSASSALRVVRTLGALLALAALGACADVTGPSSEACGPVQGSGTCAGK